MVETNQIDLAHEPAFEIGTVTVKPSTREIVGPDHARDVIEPRMMQVLVVLAKADGAMVSRDDLIKSCWEGRIVGDDAINRVISRLRRVAEGAGNSSFRIETVTKVGYRLVRSDKEATAANSSSAPGTAQDDDQAFGRRRLIVGGAALLGTASLGGLILALPRGPTKPDQPKPKSPAARLMDEGLTALRQTTGEGNAQAMGLFRRVTMMAPEYGDGWGALALTYAMQSHYQAPADAAQLRMRAKSAADRALAIDPRNGYARNALAGALPTIGHWRALELASRQGLGAHPDDDLLLNTLSVTLASVGRMREAAAVMDHAVAVALPSPLLMYRHVLWLWSANRLDEADTALDEARQLFPLHFALWFARFFIDLYSGRVAKAIAFAEDRDHRPPSLADEEFEHVLAIARVVAADDQRGIDRVLANHVALAHRGTGYAENTIHYAAHTGRFDIAFAVANAYYLDRGFVVPARRFATGQGTFTGLADRRTWILFQPPAAPLWRDPRFERLIGELGLKRYWAAAGKQPDYLGA